MIDITPIKCCKATRSTKLSPSSKIVLSLVASLFVCLVFEVKDSIENDVRSSYNVQANTNTNTETIKIGNTKTKNYNIQESNYHPTQLTQIVVNVPKSKKLRKLRPPTEEEYMIKRRILYIYDEIKRDLEVAFSSINSETSLEKEQQLEGFERTREEEKAESTNHSKATTTLPASKQAALVSASKHLNHLGKIIQALNPKYIATYRVQSIALADSNSNLDALAASFPPLSATFEPKQAKSVSLELTGEKEQRAEQVESLKEFLSDQLDTLDEKFRDLFVWDQSFIEALQTVGDGEFSQKQLAYKRLILCLNDPNLCVIPTKSAQYQNEHQQYELELERQQQEHQALNQDRDQDREQDQNPSLDSDSDSDSDASSESTELDDEEREIDAGDETRHSEELKREVVSQLKQGQGQEHQQQQQQDKLDATIQNTIDESDESGGLYGHRGEAQGSDYADNQQQTKHENTGFNLSDLLQQKTSQDQLRRLPQQYQPHPTGYPSDTATTTKQDGYPERRPYGKQQQISAIREPTKSLITRSKSGINLSKLNEFKNFFAQQQLLNSNSNNDNRYRYQQQQQQQQQLPIRRQPYMQNRFDFRFNQQPVSRTYRQPAATAMATATATATAATAAATAAAAAEKIPRFASK